MDIVVISLVLAILCVGIPLLSYFAFSKIGRSSGANRKPYRVYTYEFDQEVSAVELISQVDATGAVLNNDNAAARQMLDEAVAKTDLQAINELIGRWKEGHELGLNPLFTVLIDHSGSMKGERAFHVAIAALYLGRLFERLEIKFEILGFTTSTWRGGNARAKWKVAGKPRNPGRLCDLLHIVYHDAQKNIENWENGLTLFKFSEFYKENVDGEALLWARDRAMKNEPSKWLCLVISDGAPVDDSTIDANNGAKESWYLAKHLLEVIDKLSANERFRVAGLGIEHRIDRYYPMHEYAESPSELPAKAIRLLNKMIWPQGS